MNRILIILLVVAIIAGILAFVGISTAATGVAQIAFWAFIFLLISTLIKHYFSLNK